MHLCSHAKPQVETILACQSASFEEIDTEAAGGVYMSQNCSAADRDWLLGSKSCFDFDTKSANICVKVVDAVLASLDPTMEVL